MNARTAHTMVETNTFLSKSQFIKGQQCLKYLYLYKFRQDLKDEISDSQEAAFQSGTDVGILAQSLFPGGVTIPFDDVSYDEQAAMTADAMAKGHKTIYEATFQNDGLFARADILNKGLTSWDINEVKASTQVKDVHYNDLAFQYYVMNALNLPIGKASIVHINNEYVRKGDVELDRLFTVEDITKDVKAMQGDVAKQIAKQRMITEGEMPKIDIGEQCSDPYDCEFSGYCWKHVPDPSVFSLRGRGIDAFGWYKQGIVDLKSLPLAELPEHAQQQVTAYLKKEVYIDRPAIKDFLDTLWYPIAFLDFETFMSAVPPFDGTWPYQQIPFQYSLHVQKSATSEPVHYSFLAEPNADPRNPLITQLLGEIPTGACVIAYNMSFEKRVLTGLGEMFPSHAKTIEKIVASMRDLMDPFRSRAYYSWEMMGSYSIKEVLPVLVPELSYKELEVGDGGAAMDAYHRMCGATDQSEVNKIREALLKYCHLDTLAMVKILVRLRSLVEN